MVFPSDDYTPFGLLANPWAEARSWTDGTGGTPRTTEQRLGLAWLEPWATRPRQALGLEIGLEAGRRRFASRADFSELGLVCDYHSSGLIGYRFEYGGLAHQVRFFVAGPDVLLAIWRIGQAAPEGKPARLLLGRLAWRREGDAADSLRLLSETALETEVSEGGGQLTWSQPSDAVTMVERINGLPGTAARELQAADLLVSPVRRQVVLAVALGRGRGAAKAARAALGAALRREQELVRADNAFWSRCPRLEGDWPGDVRRGLVYDLETTRLCLQPAAGIFKDIWPAWMVNWPRAVLAEGSLDMLRLSYAQPETAQRAILSLFRDAPAANVPCVFRNGESNMVAADGSVCGTSPAWCVPFHNLKCLYLRTLDRAWLAELYPYLAAYVRWWLAQRSDAEGWTVYRCTWEAGEDNSPRLDPDQEGDHVISEFARPVELQSAMADAGATLAFFARELGGGRRQAAGGSSQPRVGPNLQDQTPDTRHLGLEADLDEWRRVEQSAVERVQRLWDRREGRFRDWDVRRRGFIEPSGQAGYWGTDPRRFSPLALTPLLFGQTTPDQRARLRGEIEHYGSPPWCDWPSWSYVVLEAASAAGWYDFAGRLAWQIVQRVYSENDRRCLEPFSRPLPGAAREYWPTDLSTWDASEGYGWGATTASFVIRQLCGFYESIETRDCVFRLAPALPAGLLDGRDLRLGPLPYRGRVLTLSYRTNSSGGCTVTLSLASAARVTVQDEQGQLLLDAASATRHTFRLEAGQAVRTALFD